MADYKGHALFLELLVAALVIWYFVKKPCSCGSTGDLATTTNGIQQYDAQKGAVGIAGVDYPIN